MKKFIFYAVVFSVMMYIMIIFNNIGIEKLTG